MPEIGETFHRLTVVDFAGKDARNNIKALFRCTCGIEKVLHVGKVRSGEIKSCGCLRSELAPGHSRVKYAHRGDAGFAVLVRNLKIRASSRDYDYCLSDAGVRELTGMPCHYCGCAPASLARQQGNTNAARKAFGAYRYNGLDRLDNNKGYIPGNVVPCCDYCNTMKNGQTLEQFLARVRTIAARFPEGA